MNILFPVAECVPYAKTGGLADVAGALPTALQKLGHEVAVVMPFYRQAKKVVRNLEATGIELNIPVGTERVLASVLKSKLGQEETCDIYFIQQDNYYDRPELYQTTDDGDYHDNAERFIFFSLAVLELGKRLEKVWDIVHCHDWHTGLIPLYIKQSYYQNKVYQQCKSLFTIHNLAYQGHFKKKYFKLTGLPNELFKENCAEFWGAFNFMKAGLMSADKISTVSETYAQEIQEHQYGHGMDGVLLDRAQDLSGILNGIDYQEWNPETDPTLPVKFSIGQWEKKSLMKSLLLEEMKLFDKPHVPVIAMISRLDDQKGWDILASVIEKIVNLDIQLVILGTGAKKYHELLYHIKAKYPANIAICLAFDNALAHRIYAGSDMFLMPSRFEPCGLGQLISMRYGTVPIVRHTGGLADTVVNFNGIEGNGFSFEPYRGEALLALIKYAVQFYQDKLAWKRLMKNCMEANFSWDNSAKHYEALYQHMLVTPAK